MHQPLSARDALLLASPQQRWPRCVHTNEAFRFHNAPLEIRRFLRRAFMAVSSLSALCEGVCALLGVPAAVLAPDALGLLAFSLTIEETSISVLQRPAADPGMATIVVELGEPPAEAELALLRHLLNANFALCLPHGPLFARNPVTGQALLQLPCPLDLVTPDSVYRSLLQATEFAGQWRQQAREIAQPTQPLLAGTALTAFA
ncbi:CesT family type III secretion system chaperone [Ramlibacter sp. AN1015]|uniref:CesT family type III secretion system chaperone n=1 Tax=Ramlibacter sp. AN1015 TaxID=3133428 RepID=UPI0030BB5A4B